MATLHLRLSDTPHDGIRVIKVFLYHKRGIASFPTPYKVMPSEFKDGIVQGRRDATQMNLKLHAILTKYSEALERVEYPDTLTCAQLKKALQRSLDYAGDTTIGTYAKGFTDRLKAEGRKVYADMMDRSVRYFIACFYDMPLALIRPEHMEDFQTWLMRKPMRKMPDGRVRRMKTVSLTYVGICLSHIKALVNSAIRERKVHYEVSPFITTRIRRSPVRDTCIDINDINKVRLSEPSVRRLCVARDVFMLSFYLGGMNIVDIIAADFTKDELRYVRRKTSTRTTAIQTTTVPIVGEAREIVDKYMKEDGRLDFGLKLSEHNLMNYIGKGIRELGQELGIDNMVFYSARKAFAQAGLDLGIPDSTIDACLGHSPSSRGVISYYSKVKVKQVRDAVVQVVEYMKNPTED